MLQSGEKLEEKLRLYIIKAKGRRLSFKKSVGAHFSRARSLDVYIPPFFLSRIRNCVQDPQHRWFSDVCSLFSLRLLNWRVNSLSISLSSICKLLAVFLLLHTRGLQHYSSFARIFGRDFSLRERKWERDTSVVDANLRGRMRVWLVQTSFSA